MSDMELLEAKLSEWECLEVMARDAKDQWDSIKRDVRDAYRGWAPFPSADDIQSARKDAAEAREQLASFIRSHRSELQKWYEEISRRPELWSSFPSLCRVRQADGNVRFARGCFECGKRR